MHIAEPLGVPGAPFETLHAITSSVDPKQARLIFLTDRQGERQHARYAAMIISGQGPAAAVSMSALAFGPHFGEAGTQALADLAHWANSHDLPIRETVLNAPEFNRVVAEPDAHEVAALIAASNPSDAGIYTTLPQKQTD